MSKSRATHSAYLEAIQQRTVIFDGAMGTNLAAQNLALEDFGGERYGGCNDHLTLGCPRAVENVHRAFLEAGVDVIETNTFRSNRQTLSEYGLEGLTAEINQAAARLARKLADEYSSARQPRFVAGSLGPSGRLLSLRSENKEPLDFKSAADIFHQQAAALIVGGVDLLLLETQQDILEVKAAVHGIHAAFEDCGRRLPIQAQVTLDTNGRMLLGTDIRAVLAILQGLEIDVIGLNCSTGPEHMRAPLAYLSQHARLPISCLPNAGMPVNRDGGAYYPLGTQDFAEQVSALARDFGLNVVGGCCGTTPEHLKLLVKALEKAPASQRAPIFEPALSSAFHAVSLRQEPAPFIIGERLNTQGSRAFKRQMLADDYEAATRIAVEQLENGAHALDICTALTEDEREGERMQRLAALLSAQVDAPLVIDSTDPAVLECGLQAAPGRCLINSVHLEGGEEKARRILKLAKAHNAAVIALTIDENGMAKSAEHKLAVARRIHELAVNEFGLRPQDLVFDPLTFTLASGSAETLDAGIQTLDAIRMIKKELPGVFTSLGLSNISFGLNPPARAVLNSVALYHAIKAGLDMAILNPAHIQPHAALSARERELAENLLFNRSPGALADFIACFSQADAGQESSSSAAAAALEALPPGERIRQRILTRKKEGLMADLDAYVQASPLSRHESALEILNHILLPAMQEIGEQFGSGELILPFVLQSAEIMRAASDHLEKYLEKNASAAKGRLVLATVYGDVHDIGKNLVKTILSNNGYEVIDLGKQVPAETILEQAAARKADAIGLSALLVSTSQQMPQVVELLKERNSNLPVLIGGAAVNPEFAERVRGGKDGQPYRGGVYYCRDAFDALKVLDNHKATGTSAPEMPRTQPQKTPNRSAEASAPHAQIDPAPIPQAPFTGARVLPELPMPDLYAALNRSALFRISWGVRNAKGEKWEQYQHEFTKRLEEMWAESQSSGWLKASAAYGYFPCQAEGNDLLIFHPLPDGNEEVLRFNFPRQAQAPGLCLSDYFTGAGQRDLAAFQFVTLGQSAADHVHKLHEAGDMAAVFFAHGLAVQFTETAAVHMHARIRRELGLKANQGKRYSWGYPAIPHLAQHELLFKLLPVEQELGIQLTSAFQFVPEYSTAALVLHHPQAVYFQVQS